MSSSRTSEVAPRALRVLRRKQAGRATVSLAAACLVVACQQPPNSTSPPATDAGPACPTCPKGPLRPMDVFPLMRSPALDLLFVIDNSEAMGEAQGALRWHFPSLLEALRARDRGVTLPSLHVGVVTTDLGVAPYSFPTCDRAGGDQGKLQHRPRAGQCVPPTDPFITHEFGVTNVPFAQGGVVEQVQHGFSCIAALGTAGCGFEQPLEAMYRALDPKLGLNPGFLRREASLGIVIFTDEDDCSAARPELFDPAPQGLTDPLGPLDSFRCFDKGIRCDVNDRRRPGPRRHCVPDGDWLHRLDRYLQLLGRVKEPEKLFVTLIAGPPEPVRVRVFAGQPMLEPSCQLGRTVVATPGIRLNAFLQALSRTRGNHAVAQICEPGFGPALAAMGKRIIGRTVRPCLHWPPATSNGGVVCREGDLLGTGSDGWPVLCRKSCLEKADCQVEELTNEGTPQERQEPIPRCPDAVFLSGNQACGTSCPCWRLVRTDNPDAGCDPEVHGTPFMLEVLRSGAPPPTSNLIVRCVSPGVPWGSRDLATTPQCE